MSGLSLVVMLIYLIPALIVIWFMVSVVSALREQNSLLKELIEKINKQ